MGEDGNGPLRRGDGGLLVSVRVQPGASANRIDGIITAADDSRRIGLRVTAPADKGKANKAATRLLAKAWKVPPGSIDIVAGASQRNKTLLIAGEAEMLHSRLREWLRMHSEG